MQDGYPDIVLPCIPRRGVVNYLDPNERETLMTLRSDSLDEANLIRLRSDVDLPDRLVQRLSEFTESQAELRRLSVECIWNILSDHGNIEPKSCRFESRLVRLLTWNSRGIDNLIAEATGADDEEGNVREYALFIIYNLGYRMKDFAITNEDLRKILASVAKSKSPISSDAPFMAWLSKIISRNDQRNLECRRLVFEFLFEYVIERRADPEIANVICQPPLSGPTALSLALHVEDADKDSFIAQGLVLGLNGAMGVDFCNFCLDCLSEKPIFPKNDPDPLYFHPSVHDSDEFSGDERYAMFPRFILNNLVTLVEDSPVFALRLKACTLLNQSIENQDVYYSDYYRAARSRMFEMARELILKGNQPVQDHPELTKCALKLMKYVIHDGRLLTIQDLVNLYSSVRQMAMSLDIQARELAIDTLDEAWDDKEWRTQMTDLELWLSVIEATDPIHPESLRMLAGIFLHRPMDLLRNWPRLLCEYVFNKNLWERFRFVVNSFEPVDYFIDGATILHWRSLCILASGKSVKRIGDSTSLGLLTLDIIKLVAKAAAPFRPPSG